MDKNPYTELNDYELLHLIPHLIDIERFEDVHKLLGSKNNHNYWFDIKTELDLFESYVDDLRRGTSIAFHQAHEELCGKLSSNTLGLAIRYGLIFSSLFFSIERTLSPAVVAFLVINNYWKFNRAVTYFSNRKIDEATSFLLLLIDQNPRDVSRQIIIEKILNLFPKISDPERKLAIMIKLSKFLPKSKTDKILNQLLFELFESKFNKGLEFMDDDLGESKLTEVAEMLSAEVADMVVGVILSSIKFHETPDKVNILLNSLEFAINDNLRLNVTQLILSEIESSNDPQTTKANWYIKLLIKATKELKNDICNLALMSIERISGKANLVNISLLTPSLPSALLIPFFQSVTRLILHPNYLGKAIASIAKRAVELEDKAAISLVRRYIDQAIDDPCVKAIARSGFEKKLSKEESNKLVTIVFEYRRKYKAIFDTSKDSIFADALDHLVPLLHQQGISTLIAYFKENDEYYMWGQVLENLISACAPNNLDDLYIFLKSDPNQSQKVSNLIQLVPNLSKDSQNEAIKEILLTINLIEGDEFKKEVAIRDFIELVAKTGLIIPNIDILKISDLNEMIRSVMKIVVLGSKNSLKIGLIKEILEVVKSSENRFLEGIAFTDVAYYLNKLSPELKEKKFAVSKSIEISSDLDDYFNLKILLRLFPSLPDNQKKAFFNSIVELVGNYHEKNQKRISSPNFNYNESSVYTDLALIAAQLQEYETSIYFADLITELPHRTQILRWLDNIPPNYIRDIYKITMGFLEYALSIPQAGLGYRSATEIIYLIPYLPNDLILDVFERFDSVDFDKNLQLDVLNALVPYSSENILGKIVKHYRSVKNDYRLSNVLTKISSRYVQLGKLHEAKLLLDEINIPEWFIKNALEIYSVNNDEIIKREIIDVFLDRFVKSTFSPVQQSIFIHRRDVPIKFVQDLMQSLDLNTKYQNLNPFRIASKLIDNIDLSTKEKLSLLDEALARVFVELRDNTPYYEGDFIDINSIYKPAYYGQEYLGSKALRILAPAIGSLEPEERLYLFQKNFEYFMNQSRKSMLPELAEIFPSLQSIGDEDFGNEVCKNIIEIWSLWP